MKISLSIDGNKHSLNVNVNKPLSLILMECCENFPANNSCLGGNCGNCVVMLNGRCVLSCLIPAYELDKAEVVTFEGFRRNRGYRDIEKAYKEIKAQPCQQCYASKTLLIESVLKKMETLQKKNVVLKVKESKLDPQAFKQLIARELGINSCSCIDVGQLEKIIELANFYRNIRSGRKD